MAFVQQVGQVGSSSSTNILAFSSNNTAGNLIVVGSVNGGNGPTISSITDSQGNTYSKIASQRFNFSTKNAEFWYAPNIKAGANTVTVTYSAAVSSVIILAEYSNVFTASPLDVSHAAASADGGNPTGMDSGATATTAQANELVVGVGATVANTNATFPTLTAGTGYTLRNQTTSVDLNLALEDMTVSSIGTQDATFGMSEGAQWAVIVATFKATAPSAQYISFLPVLGVG